MKLSRSAAGWIRCLCIYSIAWAGGCAAPLTADSPVAEALDRRAEAQAAMTPDEIDRQYVAACRAGAAFVRQQEYSPAMQAFERALALKPNSVEALFNLGACHEAVGDPARAVHIYRRVLEVTPDDPDCYANLGTSFIKLYHREKSPVWRKMARDAWKRSLELQPDQPRIQGYLARTEWVDG